MNVSWRHGNCLIVTRLIDYVMNIMRGRAYVDHTKEINSVYALIPIMVFAFRKGREPMTQDEINRAIKWFYYSQIRARYISQLPQKLDKDIGSYVVSCCKHLTISYNT